ncbi:cobalt ECF transporter T component CbiQ, partial [Streptomyces roseofulvus]|nr:cobalt ECF transporter T component CbiQ [Streptomyces roseolus]
MLPIDAAAPTSPGGRPPPAAQAARGCGRTLWGVCLPRGAGALLVAAATLAMLLGPAGVPGRQLWRAFRSPLGFCVTGAVPLLFAVGGPGGAVAWAPDGPVH